jgi:hypothetical protein
MWSTMHPMDVNCVVLVINEIKPLIKSCICILRVEAPDGNYLLVPTDEDKGVRGDVYYVTVEQDPDQSSEGYLSACADEGKPRFNH